MTQQDLLTLIERLRGEVGDLRAELAALRADVAALQAEAATVDDETLAMLAAVVTSFLGKRVRIRSARAVAAGEAAPAWARHGRAAIQTSHQLHRGH
ncbi:MAG: hypothetical protein EA356_05670 [Geminicoccaceae bacterium]|nr:MAG: hypothetical protein EA356_05670 [Geminicoccaceae bacterium]